MWQRDVYPTFGTSGRHTPPTIVQHSYGGEIARPFISLGRGLRRALLAVFDTRGAP